MVTTEAWAARAEGLIKVYGSRGSEVHALRGIDLVIPLATRTVVVGPSGSGKSTLLRVLAARERATSGRLEVLGAQLDTMSRAELSSMRRFKVSYVPQRPTAGVLPHLSASANIRAIERMRGVANQVELLLGKVNLSHLANQLPRRLSGGEQQRLAIAVGLTGTPPVIVADEPTAELDRANTDLVLRAFSAAASAGSAVVISSHDQQVIDWADCVYRIRHGVLSSEVRRSGPTATVIDSAGRIQLPEEMLEMFPSGRVALAKNGGEVRIAAHPGSSDTHDEAGNWS